MTKPTYAEMERLLHESDQDNVRLRSELIPMCDRYREALEWISRNLTDACPGLECGGCKVTVKEVIYRTNEALKGA